MRELSSVGIDIGTTTSQLVVSRLEVSNQAQGGLVPRIGVDRREVTYRGEPALTPLVAEDEIDLAGVRAWIAAEYQRSGIDPTAIQTGAVIVTGESARAGNAPLIIDNLAGLAGDFVVTVAGPLVEAQLAGRGAGAAQWSAEHYATAVNVDIGGGSANVAAFRSGAVCGASAAMVGGRQVRLDPDTGTVLAVKPAGRDLAAALDLPDLAVGRQPSLDTLRRFTDAMAEIVVDLVTGVTSPLGELVALAPPLAVEPPVAQYTVSGGVGAAYYDNLPCSNLAEIARYGDVGPLLARSLRENPRWAALPVGPPAQTLRATVLGASHQQVSLSGSTIWAAGQLPLRNLPVVQPDLGGDPAPSAEAVADRVAAAVKRWGTSDASEVDLAISLDLPERLGNRDLLELSAGLARYARQRQEPDRALILVSRADYAKVLGQTIAAELPEQPVIVIDQVHLAEGDYIDIGEPMFDGRVVPVSVKTLVFYQ